MKSLNRQKILTYFLIIVLLAAGAYYYNQYFSGEVISDIVNPDTESVIVGEDILVLVQKLQSVTIDPSIFSNAIFTTLRDYAVPLNEENLSRPNPFAPIGIDVGIVR
ncbi:MAG TPA: hypothetical protein VGC58_00080 [Candidatus Paceibacterota bacterium]